MVLRALAMTAGLISAVGLSQFPEFSQQYMQRLGGAADELNTIVSQYSADAKAARMTLETYVDTLSKEGPLSQTQARNMQAHIDRQAYLNTALEQLTGAGPFTRARMAAFMGDRDVARHAFETYKPAIPATFEGAVFAGTGFLGGWLGLSAVFAFFLGLWHSVTGIFRKRAA